MNCGEAIFVHRCNSVSDNTHTANLQAKDIAARGSAVDVARYTRRQSRVFLAQADQRC